LTPITISVWFSPISSKPSSLFMVTPLCFIWTFFRSHKCPNIFQKEPTLLAYLDGGKLWKVLWICPSCHIYWRNISILSLSLWSVHQYTWCSWFCPAFFVRISCKSCCEWPLWMLCQVGDIHVLYGISLRCELFS
jgi:hypothetical protein